MQPRPDVFAHSLKKVLVIFAVALFVANFSIGMVLGDYNDLLVFLSLREEVKRSPIEEEAMQQARAFWESRITMCEDSFYTIFLFEYSSMNGMATEVRYVEMKDVVIETKSHPVTDVQLSNKIEYMGESWLKAKMSRFYPYDLRASKPWSDYEAGAHMIHTDIQVQKINGEWKLNGRMEKQMVAPRCESIDSDVKAGVKLTKNSVLARRRI